MNAPNDHHDNALPIPPGLSPESHEMVRIWANENGNIVLTCPLVPPEFDLGELAQDWGKIFRGAIELIATLTLQDDPEKARRWAKSIVTAVAEVPPEDLGDLEVRGGG